MGSNKVVDDRERSVRNLLGVRTAGRNRVYHKIDPQEPPIHEQPWFAELIMTKSLGL